MAAIANPRPNFPGRRESSVGRFFRWWSGELSALVPLVLRRDARPSDAVLWLSRESDSLVLWRRQAGAVAEVARFPWTDIQTGDDHRIAFNTLWRQLGSPPVGVSLGADQLLRKTLDLPVQARPNLAQVLSFEVGRQTPYQKDQVYQDQELVAESLGTNRLTVRWTLAPRTQVDALRAVLDQWGVGTHAVTPREDILSGGACANLLPLAQRPPQRRLWPWVYGLMGLVTLGLVLLALGLPLWQKRQTAISLIQPVAEAARRAEAANALRDELNRLLAVHNFPLEHRVARPTAVAVLEEVTRLLPDNTWLSELNVQGDRVEMQGGSGTPVRLIGLIEKSRLLAEASFKSPLVKGRDGDERFQLEASLRPRPAAASGAVQGEAASADTNVKGPPPRSIKPLPPVAGPRGKA